MKHFARLLQIATGQLYYNFLISPDTSRDGHQEGLYESVLSSIFYMIVVPHKHIPM